MPEKLKGREDISKIVMARNEAISTYANQTRKIMSERIKKSMELPVILHHTNMRSIFIFLFFPLFGFAQMTDQKIKYPFDLSILNKLSYSLSQNDTIIPIYHGGRFQYINSYTKKLTSIELFDEAYPFHRNYGLVKKDGKYGIIDKNGNYVLKPSYYKCYIPSYPDIIGFENGQWFLFADGKLHDGFAGEEEPSMPQTGSYKENGKYGLILKGDKKTPPIFDSVLNIDFYFIILKKSNRIGIIDNAERTIVPFIYDDFIRINSEAFALEKNSVWYYFKGVKMLFESKFKPAAYNDNSVLIFETGSLYNYFDESGRVVLAKNYKWISQSGKVAINQKGDIVLLNRVKKEFIYYKNSR